MADLDSWITLAHILRPQGRKGEVLADLLTDFPESLAIGRALFLAAASAPEKTSGSQPAGPGSLEPHPVEITGSWLPHGRNQGRIVLQFADVHSIDEAERLTGCEIVVPAAERVSLHDSSVYISDLIGLKLCSGASELGTVTGVSFPLSPDGRRRLAEASPLLVVQSATEDEILVPFVQRFLIRIDAAAGVIEMDLPDGLLDVNSVPSPRTEPSET